MDTFVPFTNLRGDYTGMAADWTVPQHLASYSAEDHAVWRVLVERQTALAELMFPGPLNEYLASRERYGDVSLLPTAAFFYGLREGEALQVDLAPGVRVIFEVSLKYGRPRALDVELA